jgi:hypothetical protein
MRSLLQPYFLNEKFKHCFPLFGMNLLDFYANQRLEIPQSYSIVDYCLFQAPFTNDIHGGRRAQRQKGTTPSATPRFSTTDIVGAVSCLSFSSFSVAILGVDTSKYFMRHCRAGIRFQEVLSFMFLSQHCFVVPTGRGFLGCGFPFCV